MIEAPHRGCRIEKFGWQVSPSEPDRRTKGGHALGIPVFEQAKIQAQVLVPLVKTLQAELGEERANALVPKALGDVYRRFGEQ